MKDKTFRNLALDGGGIKGISIAKVLTGLENRLKKHQLSELLWQAESHIFY